MKHTTYEYMINLVVYKDKSFEESQRPPCGFNSIWCNGSINAHKGKQYIGQFKYIDKPKVAEKLKEIYIKTQNDITNDPDAGMAILWITLKEDSNGEIT